MSFFPISWKSAKLHGNSNIIFSTFDFLFFKKNVFFLILVTSRQSKHRELIPMPIAGPDHQSERVRKKNALLWLLLNRLIAREKKKERKKWGEKKKKLFLDSFRLSSLRRDCHCLGHLNFYHPLFSLCDLFKKTLFKLHSPATGRSLAITFSFSLF